MEELSKQYNPKEAEDRWYNFWEENKLFAATSNPSKKPFCIVIPPPNVTGILHMGHALNNTIQDILIRYHRMKGQESLWVPGTDHAGIATQNVVEKSIAKEGLTRQDLGREKFIERVWVWRQEYGSAIIRQLKKIGSSCDWGRARFTMDEEYSKAVVEVFVRLFEKGLIYQGNYIINWCPRCQTALSDEEAPHHDLNGNLYYLRYSFKDNPAEYVVVATTRPETMLGDTAVAVHPKDKRYKKHIGKSLVLPLVNREIKIIADEMVDVKFGTGAVKVTPAHDPNDYTLGKKHNLEFVNVMYPDGRMNQNAAEYKDMDRFEAREAIVEDLKVKGLLEKIEPHQLSAGHCYRCHTIIEPYLSKQWFVKMAPMAKPAIEAVKKGKVAFHPKRWTKVYLNWMENIQDWCISRQIWWGHRIPVYYCKNCKDAGMPVSKSNNPISNIEPGVIVSRVRIEKCPVCGSSDIYQDEDVLDTWFSSWLWPFATFYWPDQTTDLNYFYPTSALVTAPEIIFFWVARMIMAGHEFMGKEPFKDVYIHGTVRDIEGKKMSKSLGNVIDPLEIINEYGADALRFSLITITAQGQDVFLSKERFEQGRNFANKIWNASRFILMNLKPDLLKTDAGESFKKEDLNIINRWILSRFYSVLKEVDKDLTLFKFNEAANCLYSFFWHEFCDWYLEMVKLEIENPHNQRVMYEVLEKFLKVAHPFMPFVTEEIWQKVREAGAPRGHPVSSIMVSPWPHIVQGLIDKKSEKKMFLAFELITLIRNMRAELDIPPVNLIPAKICGNAEDTQKLLTALLPYLTRLCRLSALTIEKEYRKAKDEFVAVHHEAHIVLPLSGVIDIEGQKKKLDTKILKAEADLRAKEKTLGNVNFITRAPLEVVEAEKEKIRVIKETIAKLKEVRDGLE